MSVSFLWSPGCLWGRPACWAHFHNLLHAWAWAPFPDLLLCSLPLITKMSVPREKPSPWHCKPFASHQAHVSRCSSWLLGILNTCSSWYFLWLSSPLNHLKSHTMFNVLFLPAECFFIAVRRIGDIFKEQHGAVPNWLLFALKSSLSLEAEEVLPVFSSSHRHHVSTMTHISKLTHVLGLKNMLVIPKSAISGVSAVNYKGWGENVEKT